MIVLSDIGTDHFLHSITAFSVLLAIIGFLCVSYELLDRPRGTMRWLIQVILPGLVLVSLSSLFAFWLPDTISLGPLSIKEIVTNIAVYGALIVTFNGLFTHPSDALALQQFQLPFDASSISPGKPKLFKKIGMALRKQSVKDGLIGFLFASFYWLVITYLVFGYEYYDTIAWLSDCGRFALTGFVGGIVWQSMHHSRSKSTFAQPPGTKPTTKPRIFSFLAGLTFWAVVCIVLYVTAALVFAGWHIAMKVSDAVLLGTVGVVLLGGFLSGFVRFRLLSENILLTLVSWCEIWFVFGIAVLLPFFLLNLNHNAILVGTIIMTIIIIVVGGVYTIIFWLTKDRSAHKTSLVLLAKGDYLAALLFRPVIWFGLEVIVVFIFLAMRTDIHYELPRNIVLSSSFVVLMGSLVAILPRLFFCWPKLPQLIASSKTLCSALLQRKRFGSRIWQSMRSITSSHHGRPPIFLPRNSLFGLVFWAMVWFLSASIAEFISKYFADLNYSFSVSEPYYPIDSSFILSRLNVIVVIALTGAIIGGFSTYLFWWIMHLPGKGLGILGVILTITGFFAQLVEPGLLLSRIQIHGHSAPVYTLEWSPDGTRIASGSLDGSIQIWDATSGNTLLTHRGYTAGIHILAWSPDGTYIATGSLDKNVQVWITKTGHLINWRSNDTIPVYGLAWSPDGNHVAYTGDNAVWVWNLQGQFMPLYPDTTTVACNLAWSPNGKYIAAANDDGTVSVWDVASQNTIFTYHGHTGAVEKVDWSPDNKRIVSAGSDSTVKTCNALSTRKKGIASDRDNTVQIWDATTGGHVFTYRHSAEVTCVAWSKDTYGIQHLASSSADGTVQIWDPVKKSLLLTYHGHTGAVDAVAWSSDGIHIASAGIDKTVQIWDATTGTHLYTYISSESS